MCNLIDAMDIITDLMGSNPDMDSQTWNKLHRVYDYLALQLDEMVAVINRNRAELL